ncbi:MAG: hypothetical protein VX948_03040, partial [Candidatus Latescibacterota bacterium]|nr:hypothetical protein [Candidatus Latescibacterota bacterium]
MATQQILGLGDGLLIPAFEFGCAQIVPVAIGAALGGLGIGVGGHVTKDRRQTIKSFLHLNRIDPGHWPISCVDAEQLLGQCHTGQGI